MPVGANVTRNAAGPAMSGQLGYDMASFEKSRNLLEQSY
jgi:hypothetical protein